MSCPGTKARSERESGKALASVVEIVQGRGILAERIGPTSGIADERVCPCDNRVRRIELEADDLDVRERQHGRGPSGDFERIRNQVAQGRLLSGASAVNVEGEEAVFRDRAAAAFL